MIADAAGKSFEMDLIATEQQQSFLLLSHSKK